MYNARIKNAVYVKVIIGDCSLLTVSVITHEIKARLARVGWWQRDTCISPLVAERNDVVPGDHRLKHRDP